jgi:acetyltransferase-like isoleucine patch superfamily enzyme
MDFLKLQNRFKARRARIYTALLRGSAGKIGKNSVVCPPFHSSNIKQVYIGENCNIRAFGWIQCVEKYKGVDFEPEIIIGDRTYIGHFSHIIACEKMRIGKNVAIAERVYISDNIHGFENIEMPILSQPLKHSGPVTIHDEAWIGDGACVLPGVTIGKHSVVGSNSVVTKDIPPFCVAVGIPAKVIKQYNHKSKCWERIDNGDYDQKHTAPKKNIQEICKKSLEFKNV